MPGDKVYLREENSLPEGHELEHGPRGGKFYLTKERHMAEAKEATEKGSGKGIKGTLEKKVGPFKLWQDLLIAGAFVGVLWYLKKHGVGSSNTTLSPNPTAGTLSGSGPSLDTGNSAVGVPGSTTAPNNTPAIPFSNITQPNPFQNEPNPNQTLGVYSPPPSNFNPNPNPFQGFLNSVQGAINPNNAPGNSPETPAGLQNIPIGAAVDTIFQNGRWVAVPHQGGYTQPTNLAPQVNPNTFSPYGLQLAPIPGYNQLQAPGPARAPQGYFGPANSVISYGLPSTAYGFNSSGFYGLPGVEAPFNGTQVVSGSAGLTEGRYYSLPSGGQVYVPAGANPSAYGVV